MKTLRSLFYVLLMAFMCHAGEVADKQMEKFFGFLKKGKYEDAATAILEKGELTPEQMASSKTSGAGILKRFTLQHGKPLNYTKWRTKRLSKGFDETVYQLNCEKSAWMVMIREYTTAAGDGIFTVYNLVTEDDIFQKYGN